MCCGMATEMVMSWPCCIIMIITAFTSWVSAQSHEDNLLTFGPLKELMLQNYNLTFPRFIQPDIMNPGEYLFSERGILIRIHADNSVSILAGKEFQLGSVESVIQIEPDTILLYDVAFSCFHKYNRTSRLMTTYAGICGSRGSAKDDELGFRLNSTLPTIIKTLYLPEEGLMYHLASASSTPPSTTILEQNMTSGIFSLVKKSTYYYMSSQMDKQLSVDNIDFHAIDMVIDSTHENFYILHFNGLSKVSRTTWEETVVMPPRSSNSDRMAIDGPLKKAHLIATNSFDWLIEDQVLVASEHSFSEDPDGNSKLRVINLVDGYVSSLCQFRQCDGEQVNDCGHRKILGNTTICQLYTPYFVRVYDGVMHIISIDGIEAGGHTFFLKMQSYTPQCHAPSISRSSFEPTRDSYKYLDTVLQVCETGYALPPSHYLLTCVRSHYVNGTMTGRWNPQPLTCEKLNITGIHPDKGQKKGGTLVSLIGFIPRRMILQVGDYSRAPLYGFSFTMPPEPASTNGNPDPVPVIVTVIDESNGSEYKTFNFTYKYLPNPKLVDGYKYRQDSFLRGGSGIKFMIHNAGSAYNYSLQFADMEHIEKVPEQKCIARINNVECDLPDFEKYYNNESVNTQTNQMQRDTTDQFGKGRLTLRADGELVDGAENLPFHVYPENPVIYNFTDLQKVYEIGSHESIAFYGENLNLGVLEEDYNITLYVEAKSGLPAKSFQCSVTGLTNRELKCQPEEDNGLKELYITAITASVQVRIGQHLVYEPGDITLVPGTAVTSGSGRLPDEAVIAVSAVGSILLIVLIVVIIWFCYYKRQQKQEKTNVELISLHDRMKDKYKEDIKDYLIDPELLSFDPASELLGKGQFGNVYRGQLMVDDVIKLVAVKTLKESEDVGVHQSELEDFLDEACFLKGYKHRNVLGTVGIVWKSGDKPIMVLPYMSRGSLKSLLQNPSVTLCSGDLVHFAMQVACGMQYLSENGFVHRDLAARNCLVNEAYIVRISDFGMSRAVDESHYYREGMIQRPKPVRWMALESLTDCKYNTKTDVWSFGVLLWELFTRGGLPYEDISNNEIREFLLSGKRLEKTGDMDDMMYAAMLTCWNKDSKTRPTFEELHTFFKDCLTRSKINDPSTASNDYSYVQDCTNQIEDGYLTLYSDLDTDLYVQDKLKKDETGFVNEYHC